MIDRTRSTNLLTQTQRCTYVHTDKYGNVGAPYTYGSVQGYEGSNDSISDEKHPGFAHLRAHGQVVLGPMQLSKYSRSAVDADITYGPYGNWGTEHLWGDLAAWIEARVQRPLSYVDNDIARMKSLALTSAYAKVNSSTLCSAEYIAEMKQTLDMLRSPFNSSVKLCCRILNRAKREVGRSSGDLSKATANAWLEYRYGWRPIISDATKIMEMIGRTGRKMRVRLVARSTESVDLSKTINETVAGGLPRISGAEVTARHTRSVRASAGVIYEVQPHTTPEQLLEALGLRARDIPASVWELIPFSFVADWFMNVGSWLQAVMPAPQVSYLGNWITTVDKKVLDIPYIKTYTTLGPQASPYLAAQTFWGTGGSSLIVEDSVTRDVNQTVSSTPVLTFQPMSIRRRLDAMALTVGKVTELLGRIDVSNRRK